MKFVNSMLVLAVLVLAVSMPAYAAEPSAAELAKQAQNPIANMISVPIQNNTNFGIGSFDRNQNVLNIQPVIPAGLGSWNLINRTIIPLISQPDLSQSSGSTFGLGDITYQGFFTPAGGGAVTWGIGPVVILPTATDDVLGSKKWSAGPAAIVVAMVNKWVLGGVVFNAWSFAGDSDRADVNQGSFQYFINYNLPKAWYLTSAPMISVNWEAPSGNQWIVPFGGGFGKIFGIGGQKLNGNVSAYWNAVKPDLADGPDWTLRLQLAFLFPR